MDWLISANSNMCDHAGAFQKWGFIDWKQGNKKYSIGDNVYIYCTKPIKKIMYKTVVEKVQLTKNSIVDNSMFWYDEAEFTRALDGYFARLRLIEQVDRKELSLDRLLSNGLNAAPQGPIKLNHQLKDYIDQFIVDSFHEDTFPDSATTESCIEGAKIAVYVNRYERSSIARQKCITAKGCYCHVCGLNFEEQFGEIGRDFIHVHHVIPLYEISEAYIVDPINDLTPVCPNCHAMLHRKIKGAYLSIEELKSIVEK